MRRTPVLKSTVPRRSAWTWEPSVVWDGAGAFRCWPYASWPYGPSGASSVDGGVPAPVESAAEDAFDDEVVGGGGGADADAEIDFPYGARR